MAVKDFTCLHCGKPTTITEGDQCFNWDHFLINKPSAGDVGLGIYAVTCPNPACKQLSLRIVLAEGKKDASTRFTWTGLKNIKEWQLLPESNAKILPDYIPRPITADYYEACRIRDLSPKASATLARRCLQGMIRDFWKITKDRLKDEIDALEGQVDPLVWAGIDAVRSVGNIGAHMEKDISVMTEVEADEAQLLIGLIERLIDDWYVDRHNKQNHLEQLRKMAAVKDQQRKSSPSE